MKSDTLGILAAWFIAFMVAGGGIGAAQTEASFGPFELGPCLNCDEIELPATKGAQPFHATASFDRGDFLGIWGSGGVATVTLETFDGGRLHVNWAPNGHVVVSVWSSLGSSIDPADPDFVGIWGSGGVAIAPAELFGTNGIWGTGGVAFGYPLEIDYVDGGDVRFTVVETDKATITVNPGE